MLNFRCDERFIFLAASPTLSTESLIEKIGSRASHCLIILSITAPRDTQRASRNLSVRWVSASTTL